MESKMKWEVRINNQGNPEAHMVTLNNNIVNTTKVEIIVDIENNIPQLRLTLPMVKDVNDITITTDTTPFVDQVVIASGKEKGE